MTARLAIFASGDGSNFEAIVSACRSGRLAADVVLMVTDRPAARVVERAARLGVETFAFSARDYASKADYEARIVSLLDERRVDLVCLAGYMRILSPTMLDAWEGRIVNIHPSLLPAFRGADAIGQAMAAGVKVYGVTVHFVTGEVDGGRIVAQRAVHYEGSDREELTAMIHAVEHELYPEAIGRLIGND